MNVVIRIRIGFNADPDQGVKSCLRVKQIAYKFNLEIPVYGKIRFIVITIIDMMK